MWLYGPLILKQFLYQVDRTLWQSSGATRNSPWGQMNAWFCNASGQDEAGPLKNLLVGAHVTWESFCELTDRRPANLHHSPCPEGGAGLLVLARTASRILAWPSAKLLRKAIGLSLSYTHLTCQKNPSFLSCGTRNVDLNILITTEFLILRQKLATWFLNEQYFIPTLPTECFSCVTLRKKVQKAIVSQVQRGFVSHIANHHSPTKWFRYC